MLSKTVVLSSLLALTSAAPATQKESPLYFTVGGLDGPTVSVNAVTNGTIGNLVLEAERISAYPGTPAYFTGQTDDLHLHFDLSKDPNERVRGVYGAHIQAFSKTPGAVTDVTAIFELEEGGFSVDKSGRVHHKSTSKLKENFFACADNAEGTENVFLKWGVYNGDKAPEGCTETKLIWTGAARN